MITITRKLAVINGFVEVPNARIQAKTAVTPEDVIDGTGAIEGTKRRRLTESGGRPRHNMKFVEFPAFDSRYGYPEDWFAELNGMV